MARTGGTMLALGAAALTLLGSATSAPAAMAGATTTTGAAATTLPARARELLVQPRGGRLQKITLAPGLDPQVVARKLRARKDLFVSAGANLLAHAAGEPVATGAATTPATIPGSVLPPTVVPGAGVPAGSIPGWVPNDHIDTTLWSDLQWNFVGAYGVNASLAWSQLRALDPERAGGRRVRIALIDSGVAYRTTGRYRASPDLPRARILQGYDFVDEDRFPDDTSGHGTHVASTIAAATDNAAGLTGLAYEADIIPIRVLDERNYGDVLAIARGIRYAVRRHADLINLSADFPVSATAADIPYVLEAIEYARHHGVLVISSSGNDGTGQVALPARSSSVLAVGATTARGCRSKYSNGGSALGLVAPGGGLDHRGERTVRCQPGLGGPPIAQVTLQRSGDPSTLGVPLNYVGTSMASAHVTGIAALVLGSRILGRHPSPQLLAAYLTRSTRDLGPKGWDSRYGAGLIDAAKATNPVRAIAAIRGARRAVAKAVRAKSTALPIGGAR